MAVSWQTFSDGAGGTPTIIENNAWGKLTLDAAEEGRSSVYNLGDSNGRTYTVTQNKYGSGYGSATVQIRGSETSFNQDDVLPAWENYSSSVMREWQYIQMRVIKE